MKKSKKKISDAVNAKPKPKKLNPFEVHVNRKKFDVLGMKSKSDKGLPGVSRSKSLFKRKETLLQEYKVKDKKNMFMDKRIGERNFAMTDEDKILARYTAERMKFHSKKSIYNLGDDEELTHKGQTLTEIEKYDNPRSDDEEEEDETDGKLDPNFVGEAHFGGGMFKKVEGESKSRRDLIDQLIAESIKRKAEKQKLRQQTLDLTEKLDTEWKELLPLVTATKKTKGDVEPEDKKNDKFQDYDVLSKKLKFEARGKPSDKLKSEEELAKEEKEKLEELERDRIRRMLGESVEKAIKHRSADDLDDGFDLGEKPQTFISYKNGVMNVEENSDSDNELDTNHGRNCKNEEENEAQEEEENDEDDDEEEGEEEDEETMEVCESENRKDVEKVEEDDENENSAESESENPEGEEEEEDDDMADLSDLKSDEDGEEISEEQTPKPATQNTPSLSERKKKSEEQKAEDLKRQKEMNVARKELPYTFEIPKEYEEFEKLMKDYDHNFQSVIVERMIKCHHPSLKKEHKEDLDTLYSFLLQHMQDSASEDSTKLNCFKILDRLSQWFFDLTQWNPKSSAFSMVEVIKEKYQDFLKKPNSYPGLDTLIFLKLVSILFPTSDFRHEVVTPCFVFMQQMLFQCPVQTSIDLSRGLFIVTLLLEYCSLSKRFVPEAVNFLYSVLRLAHSKNANIPVMLPFKTKDMDSFNLIVTDKSRDVEDTKLSITDLLYINSSEEFKVNALRLTLNLLSEFCDFWEKKPEAYLIYQPFVQLLDSNSFSDCLKKNVEEVLEKILEFKKEKLRMLVLEKKKPKPLRLYEPHIEPIFNLKNYQPMSKEKTERAKLVHKYKREMKGALREIRRDRTFLAKLKFKEIAKSDAERKRKVREIYGSLASDTADDRKFRKKKK